MGNLRPGHHGYAYQDILTGNAFVELLLDLATTVKVDLKDFNGDLFDDITIAYADGRRVRLQIKHTTIDRELPQATFTGNGRHLRLDLLLRSLLIDLAANPDTTYRVVVRDGRPDDDLAQVLSAIDPSTDPGDPLPGITTQRHKFDLDKLTQLAPWKALLSGLTDDEVRRACERLVVDTGAPAANLSFSDPGPADVALLQRATELGAGRPPNINRSPEEVALTLLHAATKARATDAIVTRASIAAEVRLTTDFGAVRDGHPVEPGLVVTRQAATSLIKRSIDATAPRGGHVVLVGEPGSGKSWLSQQVADAYKASNWIVARHHCWLGETDSDRTQRVLAEVVIGSLLNQLELQAPDAVAGVRPRFAATAETLAKAIRDCRTKHPGKKVLLIVDGLDHIDRIRGRNIGGTTAAPARAVVDQLANISLPGGVCLLLASQPGLHLEHAKATSGTPLQMPRMSADELAALAERHEALNDPETGAPIADSDRRTVVDLLDARSNGNALFATYLCRHATGASPLGQPTRAPATVAEVIERLRRVPENAKDLGTYYQHLLNSLTDGELQAVGALAICDFALTKDELGELLPVFEPVLDKALTTLAPVLVSLPGAGGLKVHHESLSRHIRRDKTEAWTNHIRQSAADWLQRRGFFNDTRAFRNVPQLLADLGRYDDLIALIDRHFVSDAIANLQPPEAIKQVLSTVATEAQNRRDWKTLIICVEALRAVGVYEHESLPDTLVEYADVVVSILSADVVAERLIYEGRTTFPARWGLRLCEAVDRAGVPTPWDAYLAARKREAEADNTHYGHESDARLYLSEQLGHLRLRYDAGRTINAGELAEYFDEDHPDRPPLDQLVEIFASAVPVDDLLATARAMTNPTSAATVFITLADLAAAGAHNLPAATDLAREAVTRAPASYISDYLDHGVPASDLLTALALGNLPAELRTATQTLLTDTMGERPDHVGRWIDLLRLAHAIDPNTPITINGDISGEGFYRAWLRFAVDTVGLDEDVSDGKITPEAASAAVRVALEQLAANASPFTGNPRACDLWSIHHLIHEVVERALRVVLPDDLDEVLTHVTAIGENTTTSLMGMAEGGPLATNDLLAILSRLADRIGIEPIHKLMPAIRNNRYDANTMYSVTADFETAMARICLDAGDQPEAEACWTRAAALLCTYGGHKDSTIYEFIGATEDLADLDINQARRALARLQDAVYLAADHSDGRGTNHAPSNWWEQVADLDPIGAATAAADTLIREYGFEDYLAHVAHTQTLSTHIKSADPIALAALRYTVGPDWRQPTTDRGLLERLQGELGTTTQGDTALAIFANNVAASYDNQALMYAGDLPTCTAPPDLVAAVQALGGPAFTPREPRDRNTETNTTSNRINRDPVPVLHALEASLRPEFGPGPQGAALAVRDYQDAGYRPDPNTIRYNLDTLATTIGWRILEATSTDGAQGGKNVLDAVARELRYMTADELFATLADGLAEHCDGTIRELEQVASYAYTLAYTRIRGGGGWQTFAGRERAGLWAKARELHPDTADDTLAASIAYNIATERYGLFGITQAVAAAFAAAPAQGIAGNAPELWNAAFNILEERLPGTSDRTRTPYTPTPAPDDSTDINTALATLSVAAICKPKTEDIRAALLALTLLIACRPQLAQAAVIPLLDSELDAGRHTWILETLRDHLPLGDLTDRLAESLTALATSDRLSTRSIAGEILQHHDRPSPNPPATIPDGAIRLAVAQALDET